ncbi:MAG: phenylalanine--tRNA ligase beta subunit-related protein [Candidatus Paceibacterota bacterium]|jgi:phenylalanyl-tRNA synthetase beta subunit
MKFLKSWLQDYIVDTLPGDEVVADTLNKKSFEVEEIISLLSDAVYDIKVLPNRAHDALGHRGMARELCADFGYTFKEDKRTEKREDFCDASVESPVIAIGDAKTCTRFMGMRIDGVVVRESPVWLKERLNAIGQKSINNIVDITNYAQFALNKPMHAYDTRSIKGTLCTRFAHEGEALTTLDDKELKLDDKTLVIADDEKVLGLAGIKGGKYSGINPDTTSVILESANFAPGLIRKTSEKYGIRTDASKRFENGIANSLVEDGLYMTANLIKELCGNAKASEVVDVYPQKDAPYHVGISLSELNDILGTEYEYEDVESVFERLSFEWRKVVPEEEIALLANRAVGAPYRLGSSVRFDSPAVFDCSSFTSWLYVHSGISIPRMSVDQYVYTKRIEKKNLKKGDLVFANNNHDPVYTSSIDFLRGTEVSGGINHVGIYVGDGNVTHATSMYKKVVTEKLDDAPRFKDTVGYGRVNDNLREERFVVTVPSERLDIRIKEDIAEEIGRILGYDKLVPILPKLSRTGLIPKRMYYENKIREILIGHGFSEVMTYSFGDKGEISIVKGLADDKEKLRANLASGIRESLNLNLHNAPLLGQKVIKIFEFGDVFTKSGETRKFGFAIDDGVKRSDFDPEVKSIVSEIEKLLGVPVSGDPISSVKPCIAEIDFDVLIETLPEPSQYEAPVFVSQSMVSHKTVSSYPFALRDIAVFVPSGTSENEVRKIIENEAGDLLVRTDLFDRFEKDGKISYAFHLVFQSFEKTLSDDELDEIMNKVTDTLNNQNSWQVR